MTGDYSRGASGFWIENGEIAFPVTEMTIAGNLKDMFLSLTPADDLEFRYGTNSPTVRIEGLTVAGGVPEPWHASQPGNTPLRQQRDRLILGRINIKRIGGTAGHPRTGPVAATSATRSVLPHQLLQRLRRLHR